MYNHKVKPITLIKYLLGVVGIIAGVLLVRNYLSLNTSAENIILRLTSASTSFARNQEYIASVFVDTRGQSISAAQIEIQWDTNYLDVLEITNANYLPVTLIPGAINGNIATITLGAQVTTSGASPRNGTGVLANVRFRTKSISGTTPINFTNNTQVAAIGSSVNVVGTAEALNILIAGATPTPGIGTATPIVSPTPSPTRSPSPTPTRSPSPTPTSGGVATPTPTGKGGATATPTATSRPGDANGDGIVNIIDIGLIIDNYGLLPITDPRADLNRDGSVNIIDIGIVIDNYGN